MKKSRPATILRSLVVSVIADRCARRNLRRKMSSASERKKGSLHTDVHSGLVENASFIVYNPLVYTDIGDSALLGKQASSTRYD